MIKDIEGLISKVVKDLQAFADVGVVGLSGGADSTLVAILSKRAFGRDNVYGVHMPYNDTDTKGTKFNARSVKFADHLDILHFHAPVTKIADEISETVGFALAHKFEISNPDQLSVLNRGNARSRARMTVLYGIAHHLNDTLKKRVRVIGTGNLSEDFIGYDTKGGDALCDIFPIGTLFKSEVYQLLDYFRERGEIEEDHIDRVPSAGLWDGHTDEGELGHSYNAMEPVIQKAMAWKPNYGDMPVKTDLDKLVLDRYFANKHKHEAPTVIDLHDFRG